MDKSNLYEIMEEMKERIGVEETLDALSRSLSSDVLEDHLRYINRMYDLNIDFDKD